MYVCIVHFWHDLSKVGHSCPGWLAIEFMIDLSLNTSVPPNDGFFQFRFQNTHTPLFIILSLENEYIWVTSATLPTHIFFFSVSACQEIQDYTTWLST